MRVLVRLGRPTSRSWMAETPRADGEEEELGAEEAGSEIELVGRPAFFAAMGARGVLG